MEDGYSNVSLVGIGKLQHISAVSNWTDGSNASVCVDGSENNVWNGWAASQRDLFVLDHIGNVVLEQNVTVGLPGDLEELIIQLINEIPDCDPNLMCGGALTCIDGLLYPTTCGPDNCDDPIDTCSDDECIDGEVDNTNPCNPKECYNGQWYEIIIDCPEGFGIPCEDGVYIQPPEGVCCSTCELYGDVNNDAVINVVDIVLVVSFILGSDIPSDNQYILSDINVDGSLNVVDIVMLVNLILN